MSIPVIPRQHSGLTFAGFTDKHRHDLVAGIKQSSTTSQLVLANQGMQTSLAALLLKDTALAQASGTVLIDRAKLSTDLTAEVQSRSNLDGEIRAFATLAEGGAKTQADLTGAGLPGHAKTPKATLPPDVPEAIDTRVPVRGHGRATVSAHETGKVRHKYVAEWSPEIVTASSWAPLGIGNGKTRVVTGASGTKVWVRFARVRGQLQSGWCTPVLVTIP